MLGFTGLGDQLLYNTPRTCYACIVLHYTYLTGVCQSFFTTSVRDIQCPKRYDLCLSYTVLEPYESYIPSFQRAINLLAQESSYTKPWVCL